MATSIIPERACVVCGEAFVPRAASAHRQVTCGGECRERWKHQRNRAASRDHIPTEGSFVVCPCGEPFPREYDRLGRPTTRRLCPSCRTISSRERELLARPDIPDNAPRCRSCTALSAMVGGLDADGLCVPCVRWAEKRARREALAAAGLRLTGVGWVPEGADAIHLTGIRRRASRGAL